MKDEDLILGLDLGANSLGWSLIRGQKSLVAWGVRIFKAGLEDMQVDGTGKPPNQERRQARLRRRQVERRARRLAHVARLLQRSKLLPPGDIEAPQQRHSLFSNLDSHLMSDKERLRDLGALDENGLREKLQAGPCYLLRAAALDKPLKPYELGRAVYHLAQRRGFLSSRKALRKDKKEEGKVKKGTTELQKNIQQAGCRTLGEYLYKVAPAERLRERYTSRAMYEEEFETIWKAQAPYHQGILTEELKEKLHHAIFHQRPLKRPQVGTCQLEPGRPRAPWALLSAQRYRFLQRLNDLRIMDDGGQQRKLTPEERQTLIKELERKRELGFERIKKLLSLPQDYSFNLQRGGEERLLGNSTAASLRKIFTPRRWDALSHEDKDRVVEDLLSIEKEETLKRRAVRHWGLTEEAAEELCQLELEKGYCSFSRKALRKLLPLLEQGTSLQEAIKELYPGHKRAQEGRDLLPPVREALSGVRNPVVERSLTELRRVVNALIKRYGKPDIIRIELARELNPAKRRKDIWRRMRQQEKRREEAANKIVQEAGIQNPSRRDIEKYLLAEECNWRCPYTGRGISLSALLGPQPQFDVEHIIPYDRCLDNSFLNKTLCHVEENRRKHDRTPWEAYAHNPERYQEILQRVKTFRGPAAREKLMRFQLHGEELEEFIENFKARQLNDTRYAARLAIQYLGLLYGSPEGIDPEGRRRVQAVPAGQIVAQLRDAWGLSRLLSSSGSKTRDDHRHHAVDALVVALTTPREVKALSEAAKRAKGRGRLLSYMPEPWRGFHDQLAKALQHLVVSHRVCKKLRGALHNETFYSNRVDKEGKFTVKRKPLWELSGSDIERILDKAVRQAVEEKLRSLGIDTKKDKFKKVKALQDNPPVLKNGKPVRRVRFRVNLEVVPIGSGPHVRHVVPGNNHHMEIVLDQRTGKWEGHVVSLLEATKRKKQGLEVVKRDHGEGKKFLFSIAPGEVLEMDTPEGGRGLYRVRTVPQNKQLYFVPIYDARPVKKIGKKGLTAHPDTLREKNCQKVVITPLGEVRYAND